MRTQTKAKFIIIITLLILPMFFLFACTSTTEKMFSRDAKTSDISMDLSQEFSFNINYEMTPKVNIDNLEITFKYYDKNNNLITTKVKYVGNVKKGIEYTISVSLTEFSFFDLFKLYSVSMAVTNGTVTYLQ